MQNVKIPPPRKKRDFFPTFNQVRFDRKSFYRGGSGVCVGGVENMLGTLWFFLVSPQVPSDWLYSAKQMLPERMSSLGAGDHLNTAHLTNVGWALLKSKEVFWILHKNAPNDDAQVLEIWEEWCTFLLPLL